MNYLAIILEKKDHLIKKIPSLSKKQQDEIIELFNKKPQFERRINWNKLDSLSYDDFRPLLAGGEVKIKSGQAKKGVDFLESDSLHLTHKAYIPLTHQGSIYLASNAVGGSEGKWCISMKKDNRWWNDYTVYANELFIFYVTPKTKYAIELNENHSFMQYWDRFGQEELTNKTQFLSETGTRIDELISKNKSELKKAKDIIIDNLPKEVLKPDSDGNINCANANLTSLEGAPKTVAGSFYCYGNELTSLKGAPQKVGGNFSCARNKPPLTSLEGAPKEVGGDFSCAHNKPTLTSLKGAPQKVGGNFDCSDNNLTSLKGAPKTVDDGNFHCYENKLTSLEGAPQKVGGHFACGDNELRSLKGAPKEVEGNFSCYDNNLTSLEGAPQKVGGNFSCADNELTSLKGAPKTVDDGDFYCHSNELRSLEGAPKKVSGDFSCSDNNLTSLEGAPRRVGGHFACSYNTKKFTEEEVRAVCKVKGSVIL